MKFKTQPTQLKDLLIIIPKVNEDNRGFFLEFFNKHDFNILGIPINFVQGNHSRSLKNVVRGLHYQWSPPSGKLIRVTRGEAFIAAVDIRINSSTLGNYFSTYLSENNKIMLWVPSGFATGFCASKNETEIQYLMTAEYIEKNQGIILWNDPTLKICWPTDCPILSEKDMNAQTFNQYLEKILNGK